MTQVSLQNAEKHWAEILQKVIGGEEIIIERDGQPVAKVSPIEAGEDWFGMDAGKGLGRRRLRRDAARFNRSV